jgi:hypothetical protein
MRVDDAVGLFWGQRVGWDMPLAHVASESEAVERAEWSVRRSELRREVRSKLGGFTLALPFVSDHRDDRHLGERHVRRTSRLSSSPQSALQLLQLHRNSTEQKRVGYQYYSSISKEKRCRSPSRRYIRTYSLTGVSRVQRCNWPRSRDKNSTLMNGSGREAGGSRID